MNENIDLIFRWISALYFVTALTISIYYRSRAERKGGKVSWKDEPIILLVVLRLGGLLLWGSMLAWLVYPPAIAWAQVSLPLAARWVGAALGAACLPLLYWLFSSIGKNISPTAGVRDQHELVTHGIYHYVRHPLYSVGTALFIAFALMAANALLGVLAVLAFVLLHLRLPAEEARLVATFGDAYRSYMQNTGRYLPKWKRG